MRQTLRTQSSPGGGGGRLVRSVGRAVAGARPLAVSGALAWPRPADLGGTRVVRPVGLVGGVTLRTPRPPDRAWTTHARGCAAVPATGHGSVHATLTRPRACGSESTGGSEGCMAGAVPTRRLPDPRGGPCGRARTTRSARKRWAAAPLRNLRKKKSKRLWRELPRNHLLRKRDTFWRMAAYEVFLFSSVRYFVC